MTALLLYAAAGVNLATFMAFGIDKRRAVQERRRIPEATLLTLAWVGGLFGGWIGMTMFRHKTQKRSFRLKMVLVSVLNVLWLAIWLYLR